MGIANEEQQNPSRAKKKFNKGVELSVNIGEITLSSPFILGAFDALIDEEILIRCFEMCGDSLGAVVTKSTTIDARAGYPEPKVAIFGEGFLVASGNCNPGIARMVSVVRALKTQFPDKAVFGSIVSDADFSDRDLAEEYGFLALEYAKAGVDGLELNLSCPHLDPQEKEHTLVPAQDQHLTARLVGRVKDRLTKEGYEHCLVIPKLTGWSCDPTLIALAAQSAGADAVTLSNLFPGTGYYTGVEGRSGEQGKAPKIGDYLVGHGKGAYSGKAMHSAVLLMIENMRKHINIPVIGSGGCATDLDSLVQTFMAGAAVIQTVTPVYFRNLDEMDSLLKLTELADQLNQYLAAHDLQRPQDLYRVRTHTLESQYGH